MEYCQNYEKMRSLDLVVPRKPEALEPRRRLGKQILMADHRHGFALETED
jgi:hypothetical protein